MPVSLISHLQVLQSPSEGLVASVSTSDTEQLFISDYLSFKTLSRHFSSSRK